MGRFAIFDIILHNWCKFKAFFAQRRGPGWLYWLVILTIFCIKVANMGPFSHNKENLDGWVSDF